MKKVLGIFTVMVLMVFCGMQSASAKVNPERLLGTWENVHVMPNGAVAGKTAIQLTAAGTYTWAFDMVAADKTAVDKGYWHGDGDKLIFTNRQKEDMVFKVISVDHNNLRVIDDGDDDVRFRLASPNVISTYPNQYDSSSK